MFSWPNRLYSVDQAPFTIFKKFTIQLLTESTDQSGSFTAPWRAEDYQPSIQRKPEYAILELIQDRLVTQRHFCKDRAPNSISDVIFLIFFCEKTGEYIAFSKIAFCFFYQLPKRGNRLRPLTFEEHYCVS